VGVSGVPGHGGTKNFWSARGVQLKLGANRAPKEKGQKGLQGAYGGAKRQVVPPTGQMWVRKQRIGGGGCYIHSLPQASGKVWAYLVNLLCTQVLPRFDEPGGSPPPKSEGTKYHTIG